MSPAVAAIIQKAMEPEPALRYQTAEEMLEAFNNLYRDVPRAKRHRRRVTATAGVLVTLFLTGGLSAFTGLRGMERAQEQQRITAEREKTALTAVSASEEAYRGGDIPKAVQLAVEALELETSCRPQAQTVSFGERQQPIPANDVFADLDLSLFQLSGDGSWLAVSFSNGGLEVFDIKHGQRDLRILENSEYARFEGGFFGPYFAFSAARDGESVFAVIDMEAGIQTGGFQAPNAFHVQAGETGICVSMENTLVKLDPVTGDQQELAYTRQGITSFARNGRHTLTLLADGSAAFYDENRLLLDELAMMCTFGDVAGEFALIGNRDVPSLRLLRLKTHPEDFS